MPACFNSPLYSWKGPTSERRPSQLRRASAHLCKHGSGQRQCGCRVNTGVRMLIFLGIKVIYKRAAAEAIPACLLSSSNVTEGLNSERRPGEFRLASAHLSKHKRNVHWGGGRINSGVPLLTFVSMEVTYARADAESTPACVCSPSQASSGSALE